MVAILVPKTIAKRFRAACTHFGVEPEAMLSYLATEHLHVLDADCADYVRGFEARARLEGTERLSIRKHAFARLVNLGHQLDAAAIYVAAALLWEHIDVLEHSPEAYGNIVKLRRRLITRKYTVGIYYGLYEQIAAIVNELEVESVRGLIYRIFDSLDLDDAVASLDVEELVPFKKRYAKHKIYPVFVPYHMYNILQEIKRTRYLSHTLTASIMLQHELDALRAVVAVPSDPGQSPAEHWMLALESLLVPELDE